MRDFEPGSRREPQSPRQNKGLLLLLQTQATQARACLTSTLSKPSQTRNPTKILQIPNQISFPHLLGYFRIDRRKQKIGKQIKGYYKYGIIEGDVVTITPTAVIDYLDRDWAFDETNNPDWQIKSLDEIKDLVAEVVYNNENSTINAKTILYTEKLKQYNLKPTEAASVDLLVSRMLATSDEISIDNETEVAVLDKTGGAKPDETPGNYIPGSGHTEIDDNMAETVLVTPATGENLNIIIPIVVGVTALVILGVGIFLIKKRALGNKE